jgi:hypothetical protein
MSKKSHKRSGAAGSDLSETSRWIYNPGLPLIRLPDGVPIYCEAAREAIYNAVAIHGGLTPEEQRKILLNFRKEVMMQKKFSKPHNRRGGRE